MNRMILLLLIFFQCTSAVPKPRILIYSGTHGDEQVSNQIVKDFQKNVHENKNVPDVEFEFITDLNTWGLENSIRFTKDSIDINRDFGIYWDNESGALHPYSQPETQKLFDVVQKGNYSMTINLHDGLSNLVSPWGAVAYTAPDSEVFESILSQIEVLPKPERKYLKKKGVFYQRIYQSCGNSSDFIYGYKGIPEFLIETSFIRSVDSTYDSLYNEHVSLIVQLIRKSNAGVIGTVLDSVLLKPITATITVIDSSGKRLWPIQSSSLDGSYHKITNDGTFSLLVEADGYESKTISELELSSDSLTFRDILLPPSSKNAIFAKALTHVYLPELRGKSKHWPFPFKNSAPVSNVIGLPDSRSYSIERDGYIAVDMGRVIDPTKGYKTTVIETGMPEGYTIAVSNTVSKPVDQWQKIITWFGTTTVTIPTFVGEFRYMAIIDDGFGLQYQKNSGADIDAIVVIKLAK